MDRVASVNWFEALKGPFKGKGHEWIEQIENERREIQTQMERLEAASKSVEHYRIYLDQHQRGPTTSVPGVALRWRATGPSGRHPHLLWSDILPLIERLPQANRDWYGQLHVQATWLNARDVALAYELRAAKTYLDNLDAAAAAVEAGGDQ